MRSLLVKAFRNKFVAPVNITPGGPNDSGNNIFTPGQMPAPINLPVAEEKKITRMDSNINNFIGGVMMSETRRQA